MSFAAMMLIGLVLDAAIGWPKWVFARVGHPVTWIGGLISRLERGLNAGPPRRRLVGGAVCVLVVVGICAGLAWAVHVLLPAGWRGIVLGGVLAWPWIAARSMFTHVADVARPLQSGDLEGARQAVSMIVGRDPTVLEPPGVARAALESLAENTSDGIVAPLFWGTIAGLPGLVAYKAINTLDSMIGHRSPRYLFFGRVAARLDDGVNLVPARLTGVLFALVSGRWSRAVRVMMADASRHRSPNAGWPEAAMAGALDLRLSGPRIYDGVPNEEPWVNGAGRDPDPDSVQAGLALYLRTMLVCAGLLAGLSLI